MALPITDSISLLNRLEAINPRLNKARIFLLTDIAVGIAFLVEVVSWFVLWLVLPHGGYQGGQNLHYGQTFILTRDAWSTAHDWFALVMVAGVAVRLVLHWKWIYYMLRKLWRDAFPLVEGEIGGLPQKSPA